MANDQFLAVDKLDFLEIKENLKTFMKQQAIFQDYDFEGSNLNVLMDLLAYNTYQNAFLLNMVGTESFLDTATLRDSIVSRSKELNYLPESYSSAEAVVHLSINVTNNSINTLTVSKGLQFTGQIDSLNYVFSTSDPIVIRRNANNQFIANNISIYEGLPVTEYFIVNNAISDQRFIISNSRVDIESVYVNVQASNVDTTNTDYTYATTLYGLNANSSAYFMQVAEKDRYEIIFGDGVFGRLPAHGNLVKATYRVASGNAVNGIASFTASSSVNGYAVSTTTASAAVGGLDRESVSSIKFKAPRHFQTQERTVSGIDYKTLIMDEFREINDVGVFGGEEITTSPQYGRIFISPSTYTNIPLSVSRRKEIETFLRSRMTLGMQPVITDPEYMYVVPSVTLKYNINNTTLPSSAIEDAVIVAAQEFNDTYLETFASSFRYSKFISAIDAADDSMISNDTTIVMMKKILPVLNASNAFTVQFGNVFLTGGDVVTDRATHQSVVYSSEITYQNRTAYIEDDGFGGLFVYENTSAGKNILAEDVGSVNYTTGTVIISNLTISAYDGDGLRIYAKPANKDITFFQNTIIILSVDDMTITVTGISE